MSHPAHAGRSPECFEFWLTALNSAATLDVSHCGFFVPNSVCGPVR